MSALDYLDDFLLYLQVERRYSDNTISAYKRDIILLSGFENNMENIDNTKLQTIIMKLNSQGKKAKTISRFASSVRTFLTYLNTQNIIHKQTFDLTLPKAEKPLPKTLTYEEIKFLIEKEYNYKADLRDRAIIAILYSSALRVSELVGLNKQDIDFDSGFIKVLGKGAKERYSPIGKIPMKLLKQYFASRLDNNEAVFINQGVKRLGVRSVQNILKKRAELANFEFNLHPHMLRHSAASHLLQSSSDIRLTQEYLGHKHITSTQVYTHLDYLKLADVYDKTHPHQK
jgi:integrase/recombinase XerC